MVEFIYNNFKNTSKGHILFELNRGYHPQVSFKDKCNAYSKSLSANRLAMELRELINVCYKNLLHTQDLQKRANDKRVNPHSYAQGEKIWFNSKHGKTKQN